MQKAILYLSMLVVVTLLVGQTDSVQKRANSNSKLTKQERSDIETLKKVAFLIDGSTAVKYADANSDGKLTLREASGFLKKYFNTDVSTQGLEEFDLDHDGFLSAQEINTEKNND